MIYAISVLTIMAFLNLLNFQIDKTLTIIESYEVFFLGSYSACILKVNSMLIKSMRTSHNTQGYKIGLPPHVISKNLIVEK